MRIGNHETHPVSEAAPRMDEERFASLVESITANGLRRKIVLYQGQILDGRHRYLACLQAGVEPEFTVYEGDDPELMAFDLNYECRDVNAMVRTFGAQRLRELQRKRQKLAKAARVSKVQRSLPVERDADVAYVLEHGVDELQAAMGQGDITASKAREIAELEEDEQRKVLQRAAEPVSTRAHLEHADTYRTVAHDVSPTGKEALAFALRKLTALKYSGQGVIDMAVSILKETYPWL